MAKKKAENSNRFPKATEKDFTVIVKPLITEKTMSLMQNENKVTVKVLESANKTEIKLAFERIFQVKVTDVKVLNQRAKSTTRGTRYQGHISGCGFSPLIENLNISNFDLEDSFKR